MTLDEMLGYYKEMAPAMTEREKAEAERDIWRAVPPASHTGKMPRRDFWRKEKGELNNIETRASLLAAGAEADPLWLRIDKEKMPVRTALKLLRKTKASGRSLAEVLTEYDQLPQWCGANGRLYRKRSGNRFTKAKTSAPPTPPPTLGWPRVRSAFIAVIEEELRGVDKAVTAEVMEEVEADLKGVRDSFRLRLRRAQAPQAARRRADLLAACRVLNLAPPRPGQPIDLDGARSRKRQLAREYHPDRLGGNEINRDRYEAVIRAYDTIAAFAEDETRVHHNRTQGGKPYVHASRRQ